MPLTPAKTAAPSSKPAAPAAAKTTRPTPTQISDEEKKRRADEAFRATKPNASRDYINAIAPGESAKYVLKVNKVTQLWAQPKAVADDRPQPTIEEMRDAKPAFSKQDCYCVEVEVLATDHPGVKPGSMKSLVFMDKYPDSYKSSIKGFIAAATGLKPEEIGIDEWAESYSNDQPLAGMVFHATASQKKAAGFTTIVCRSLDEEETAEYNPPQ